MSRYTVHGTAFFGREAELTALQEWWDSDSRLLSLVGPGGVGKTTLAWQLVEGESQAAFCDLSGARSAEVARSLLRDALPTEAPLAEALQDHGGLIVLDNLEQLDAAPELVREWLEHPVRLLCTSRRRLDLPDEAVLDVGPLPRSAAHQLFVERAARGRRVSPPPAHDVDQVLDVLDGLPLAIELAAGRAMLLGLGELLRRVQASTSELRQRGSTQRHGSLTAAIRWSYDDLDPATQRAFRWCGAFEHGFDRDAALAVLGAHADDALEELVDRSLLTLEPGPRFRLLRPLRTFARGLLDQEGEAAAAFRAHAAWYTRDQRRTATAAEVGPDLLELDAVSARCDADGSPDALRTALRAAVIGADARLVAGWSSGRVEAISALLEHDVHAPLWRAHGLAARAGLRFGRADWTGAEQDFEAAGAAFRAAGDLPLMHTTAVNLAIVLARTGRIDEAMTRATEAARGLEASEAPARRRALAWSSVCLVHHARGELDHAEEACRRAIAAVDESSDLYARNLGNLGFLLAARGALHEAIAAYSEALRAAPPDSLPMLQVLFYRATAHHELGDSAAALLDYEAAISGAEARGGLRQVGEWALAAACCLTQAGDEAQAAEWRMRSDAAWSRRPHPRADALRQLYLAASGDSEARAQLALDAPGAASEFRFPLRLIAADSAAPELEVGPEGRWFRIGGASVSLARRANLRRMFQAMVQLHLQQPGSVVSRDDLFDIGWPGERIAPDSAAHRVRVAVHTLRKLGLAEILTRQDDGWLLLPELRVVLRDESKPPTGT